MKHTHRMAQFSKRLQDLMQRAEVSDTELARRIDSNRLTVWRWREAVALPREETIHRLKAGLWWQDHLGQKHELSNEELSQLRIAAGYYDLAREGDPDRVEQTDRCKVYSNRYSPGAFPSGWSKRLIELEQSVPGSISTMWNTLSSITRPAAFYQGAYKRNLYTQEKVESYMLLHEARQEKFRERLETSPVRHLYSKTGIEQFLTETSPAIEGRPAWDFWPVPREILAKQLDTILEWLDTYDNFEVRLREKDIPANVTILSHDHILIEFSHFSSLRTGYINGIELAGAGDYAQFAKQFDDFWADRETGQSRQKVIASLNQLRKGVTQRH